LPFRPPIDEYAAAIGMQGRFKPSKIEQRIDLIKWSQRPDVLDAYKKLQKQTVMNKQAEAEWNCLLDCEAICKQSQLHVRPAELSN
jgi:hypothetical protein